MCSDLSYESLWREKTEINDRTETHVFTFKLIELHAKVNKASQQRI